ncbi:UvrD-helicase domain-containing protein [Acholeplasma equifetale]|uniref:UvrD-helicase domain-containing protein n=1 Tax=Acholeplasma equifetale TaxID=264634 RepID=UPI00047DD997|nr:UvrD-helicase domain-containing protein [Acholeplasma equifetale]
MNSLKDKYGLNDDQEKIVLDRSKEAIVPAGAGSGKTHTLVSKVVELIKLEGSLEPFLVLTFTEKAAFEMKERVKKLIKKEDSLKHLISQIEGSNIQTFDSFALNFVLQNASFMNLDSNIGILDDAVFKSIKREYMKEIMLEAYKNKKYRENDEFFLYHVTTKSSDSELIDALVEVYDKLSDKFDINHLTNTDIIQEISKPSLDEFEQLINTFDTNFINDNEQYIELLKYYISYLNEGNNSFDFIKLPRRNFKNISDPIEKSHVEESLKPILNLYKNEVTYHTYEKINKILFIYGDIVLEILRDFDKKVKSFKQNAQKYGFNDIQKFLLYILKNSPQILERMRQRYRYIFVDEYQDTSDTQSEFLDLLIKDNEHVKVLYVGDIKQSIYQFRDAKPENFVAKQNNQNITKLPLSINYRSSGKVIDFINKIFKGILDDEKKYDINYNKGHEMQAGNKSLDALPFAGVYLLKKYQNPDMRSYDFYEEAFTVGKKILELMQKDEKLEYKDFAILHRNQKKFPIYKEVFDYLNIPLTIEVPVHLNKSYFLKLVANTLMLALYIEDTNQEYIKKKKYWYYSLAKSPLFQISDFDLFNALKDKNFNIDLDIYQKLNELKNVIFDGTNQSILDTLIKTFNLYDKVLLGYQTDVIDIEIDYLYQLAQSLTDIGKIGSDFINYLYELVYSDGKLEKKILNLPTHNSVKITNIHQSKGLEYTVLFCGGLNQKFNSKLGKSVSYHPIHKLIFPNRFTMFDNKNKLQAVYENYRNEAKENISKFQLKEELRLLYVALTRAKRTLFLILDEKESYDKLECFTDFLFEKGKILNHIESENIISIKESLKDENYHKILFEPKYYYPSLIDNLMDKSFSLTPNMIKEHYVTQKELAVFDDNSKENLIKGTKLHLLFEDSKLDINSNNIYIQKFISTAFDNRYIKDAHHIYQEYPFYDEENQISGIIDLILEFDDCVYIIDYKTRDIDKEDYVKQLKSYENYLSKIYLNKPIKTFLYSITFGKYEVV